MNTQTSVNLWLAPSETGVKSKWTTDHGDLHFRDYGFDDNNREIIHLEAAFEHRTDIKALDKGTTNWEWTDSEWKIDFAAIDDAVEHFLDRGLTVTIPASEVYIYINDYGPSFLEDNLPPNPPPPDQQNSGRDKGHQHDLGDFS